ncbi:DnaJ domain-containing protein [Tanacetum coccineum]
MDPHNFIARAEAQRWVGVAEKLLLAHDFVGSKSFAIKAKDSDPTFQPADQILAIITTLLSAQKQAHNNTQQPDYYSILQVNQFVQDAQLITNQYQRLGILLNPNENRFPYSQQAFELVNDAWAVLSNPMRKSIYDSELNHYMPHQHQEINSLGFHNQQQQQHYQQQHHQHQQQFNFFANSNEHELAEPNYSFQARLQRQLQQHNFLFNSNSNSNANVSTNVNSNSVGLGRVVNEHVSVDSNSVGLGRVVNEHVSVDSNSVRLGAVVPEQHVRVQEQMFQPNVQPFQFTYIPPQPQSQPVPQQEPQVFWQQPPLPQPQPESEPQEENANEFNTNDGVNEEEIQTESPAENVDECVETEGPTEKMDESATFWTACPYCLYMFEYPRVYVDCVLRCDHCKRACQAVSVPCPPIIEGKEAYFCCWGYFPVGVSMSHLEKKSGEDMKEDWAPVSTLNDVSSQVKEHLNAIEKSKLFEKRIYIDDVTDDIFEGISETESSDDSDVEWGCAMRKKAKRKKRGTMKANVVMGRNGKNVENDVGPPIGPSNPRRQSGRFAKDLGKLDLNVELNSNEGEEGARRVAGGTHGHGLEEEDIIEGNGFFEGLDEFLDNLPILPVGNDETVEAA